MAKRKVTLMLRQAGVSRSSAFNPDKHGDELSPARDMGLKVLLEKGETAQFFGMAKTRLDAVLWDGDGEPLLVAVQMLSCGARLKIDGQAELGIIGHKVHQIEDCMLGKIRIEPMSGYRSQLYCNLHFDPTGKSEDCDRMALEERCRVGFVGSIRKEEDQGDEDTSQGKLPV